MSSGARCSGSGFPGSAFPRAAFFAAAASLPVASAAAAPALAPSRQRAFKGAGRSFDGPSSEVPLALAAVLLLLALLVAPEQPRHQEAICQRHNGVAACRVW
jgi:hypothetical protein